MKQVRTPSTSENVVHRSSTAGERVTFPYIVVNDAGPTNVDGSETLTLPSVEEQ